jgi:hypothetical protein
MFELYQLRASLVTEARFFVITTARDRQTLDLYGKYHRNETSVATRSTRHAPTGMSRRCMLVLSDPQSVPVTQCPPWDIRKA